MKNAQCTMNLCREIIAEEEVGVSSVKAILFFDISHPWRANGT